MDHDGRFGMGDQIMSQEVGLCDNLEVPSVNLNELTHAQSIPVFESEKQSSTPNVPFNNYNINEQNKPDKDICIENLAEEQDEVMREEEENSESSLICCQSPETPMTDSSYSETGSLLEMPCILSTGTSSDCFSPHFHTDTSSKQSQCCALDLNCSVKELSIANDATSSLDKNTSIENILQHSFTHKTGPSTVEEKITPNGSFERTGSASGRETPSFAEMETFKLSCATEIHINQEPSQLLEFLDQLSKRGDDTHLPLYLHQVAEAFVSHEDYQRAIWCLQLERLYHLRLLDNLNALQKQWEAQCKTASSVLTSQHLDSLKQICLTHSRPKGSDSVHSSLDNLIVPSCSSDCTSKKTMEPLRSAENSSVSSSLFSCKDPEDKSISSEATENKREDSKSECMDSIHQAQSNLKERNDAEPESGLEGTMLAEKHLSPPSSITEMDQSKTAEQQGEGLSPTQEQAAGSEEQRDVEEATEALDMEDEEDEEEEPHNGKSFTFCPEKLPVETVVSAAAVEIRLQESKSELEETQLVSEGLQDFDRPFLSHERDVVQDDNLNLFGKEEEEEDYEVEPADLIRAAATLDDLAKQITVEELAPAAGLVSILKKRDVCKASSASLEPQCNKLPAKRRVRFKVPDDGFDSDMGGGDSCILLFLLCLVTVVISIGGTALYCALGDTHSSVCQDFSRNADFYFSQIQRGISQIQHWLTPTS